MGWFRRQLLKILLWIEWNPQVSFNVDNHGFYVTMVNTIPISTLLEHHKSYDDINRLTYEATYEVVKMVDYEINHRSLTHLEIDFRFGDAYDISYYETHSILKRISEYEKRRNMRIRKWFTDYILTYGYKYI